MPKSNPIIDGMKVCTYCKRNKPVEAFTRLVHVATGLNPRCRECQRDLRHPHLKGLPMGYVGRPAQPVIEGKRKCTRCLESLPIAQFWIYPNGRVDNLCNECRHYYGDDFHLKKTFGISLEEYRVMFEAQKGLCAICQQPETKRSKVGNLLRLAVDHCHTTGKIRGLLCARCNTTIGHSFENPLMLRAMADYLEKHAD